MRYARTNADARYLPGWSKPPGCDINPDPNQQSANPNGNRAQRRRAKKLRIVNGEARRAG
jgi:hypothetical protein